MINIAIVEDDVRMSNELEGYLKRFFNENNLEFSVRTFISASTFIDEYDLSYQLIFMDINFSGMDGLTAVSKLRKIDNKVMVIFTTSLAQYAIEGYRVNAFDFILKPYNYYDLSLTLNRTLINFKNIDDNYIMIKNRQIVKKIEYSEIRYIEVYNRKLLFHTTDGVFETYGTIKHYSNLLQNHNFVLCNVCYLVNLKYVTTIYKSKVCLDKDELLISRPKRNVFLAAVNKYFGDGGNINE